VSDLQQDFSSLASDISGTTRVARDWQLTPAKFDEIERVIALEGELSPARSE
jgi:hypothetical protein